MKIFNMKMKIFKNFSISLVFAVFLSILLLWVLDVGIIVESPLFLLSMVLIFTVFSSLMVSIIAATSFLKYGGWAILWIGVGALILGLGTGLSTGLYHYGYIGVNRTVTLHNISGLFASFIFLVSAVLTYTSIASIQKAANRIIIFFQLYIGSILIVGLVFLLSLENVLPVFFIPVQGGTSIRQVVLITTIIFFLFAGSIFFKKYFNSKSMVLYFCSISMIFLAIGSIALMVQTNVGSIINWMGRFSNSIGGIYLFFFAASIFVEAKRQKIPPLEIFDLYFKERVANYKIFFENNSDAVLVTDKNEKFLAFNDAFLKFYRFKNRSECPKSLAEMTNYIEKYNLDQTMLPEEEWSTRKALKGESVLNQVLLLKRKDTGEKWYGAYNASSLLDKDNNIIGAVQNIRDITQQKNQEESILSLSRFPSEDPNPVFRMDSKLNILYANKAARKILEEMGTSGLRLPKYLKKSILSSIRKSNSGLLSLERKIGRKFYEFTIIPIVDKNYFNIYGRDVTEVKKAEKIKIRTLQDRILKMERKKIARELHDTVTQDLFSSNLFSDTIIRSWEKDPQVALKYLKTVRDLNSAALSDIHILLYNLMPEKISQQSLKELIENLLNSIKRKTGIKADMVIEGNCNISRKIKQEFYRVAQESLNNVAKHSEATRVNVCLRLHPEELKLTVSDNGKGFDVSDRSVGKRFGLQIMRERAKLIEASLLIRTSPGKGTTITLIKKNGCP